MAYSFFDAGSLPAAYDVVFCNFPYDEILGEPGPGDHPCLIIDALINDDDGNPYVRLICGTSRPAKSGERYFEVPLAEGSQAGLSSDTRFNLRKVARLPWASEFFRNHSPPRTLSLPEKSQRNLGFEAADYSRDHPNWKPFDV